MKDIVEILEYAIPRLWEQSNLGWKLYPHQQDLYNKFKKTPARKVVFHCSRRIGKSYSLLVLGSEIALNSRSIIRYGASHQKYVREIIHPLMRKIFEDCPDYLRPEWKEVQGKYIFKNGSEISVSGLDEGRADNLRGTEMNLGIIDEAGYVEDLDYVVKSVLMPQLLTTDGRLILSSTSPRSPDHPFTHFIEEADFNNALVKKTIYDDSRPWIIARIPEWMKEAGGEDSTTWRREYLCELITDEETALIPEFTPEKAITLTKEWKRPEYFISYTVMDLGYEDNTGCLFAYVDFLNAKIIIEDELLVRHCHSGEIAQMVKQREKELWGEGRIWRYADGQPITLADFNALHGLPFSGIIKEEVQAQINTLRLEVISESLIIHPRCQNLIKQLKYGVWDSTKRKFDRSPTYGHFDLVAAAMYLVRVVNKRENPYPENYGMTHGTHFIDTTYSEKSQTAKTLEQIFKF